MEAIMASLVQECSQTKNDNGNDALKLTNSQKKSRSKAFKKKLTANVGSLEKREDIISQSTLQDDPNTGIGTSATVDKKMPMSRSAGNGDEKSSTSKGKEHTKVANGITTLAMEAIMASLVQECSQMENDNGNVASKLTKSQKKSRKKALKKKLTENLGSLEKGEDIISQSPLQDDPNTGIGTSVAIDKKMPVSSSAGTDDEKRSTFKGKEHIKVANGEMGSSMTTNLNRGVEVQKRMETTIGNTSSGTHVTDNASLKRRNRSKRKNNNPDLGDILNTRKSTQEGLTMTEALGVKYNETVSSKIITPDVNLVSNNKQPTLGEILNPQYSQSIQAAKSERGSGTNSADNQASKKQKRHKLNKNSDSGDIASTSKVFEVKSDETVSAITAAPDVNMVSKEQDHSQVANGKMEENKTTNNGDDASKLTKSQLKNRRKALKKKLIANLGNIGIGTSATVDNKVVTNREICSSMTTSLNGKVEVQKKMETSSGTNPTDNTPSKKRKRKKMKNNNPDSGDILSSRESTQEGLSTTKVLEVKNDETVSDNMVSKEQDHSQVANGKIEENETTNDGHDASKLTKSPKKLKRKAIKKLNAILGNNGIGTSATVDNKEVANGEICSSMTTNLNGEVEVQKKMETSSGTNSTDNTTSKKRKRRKMKNNNPDSGDILNTRESTQEGLSTTKVLEVKNDETVSAKTSTADANMVSKEQDHLEAVNSETTHVNVNGKKKRKWKPKSKKKQPTLGGILDPLYLQNLEAADNQASNEQKKQKINNNPASGDICENTSKVLEAVSAEVSHGEDHMKDADGKMEPKVPGKKLIILDVNGLLADVVSDLPNDIIADKYITRRAIFKRPYVHEFLSFCFERFHVGIWSSRTRRNLVPVVDFLLGDLKKKLLFLWDGCKCTDSGIESFEVRYKNIVVKDLRKIWDEDGPNNSWVKGTFHESNTLLVDDSPYKGLLNPKYTGIFPASYTYMNADDNFLGPNGELQTYLEGLADADDVKTYVEQHPFGQGVIDEQDPDWVFYSSLIDRLNDKPFMERVEKENQRKRRRCC